MNIGWALFFYDRLVDQLANLIQFQAEHLAGGIAPHCDPVNYIRDLNSISVMRNHHKLRIFAQLSQ